MIEMPIEKSFEINGLEIAVKIYGNKSPQAMPVLALHGWMDNAATFDLLAPKLKGIQLIAMDFPGHGLSSHRDDGAEYYIWSYIDEVVGLADSLGLDKFSLLGHSMGGAVACLISGLYPERIEKMALLDAIGPVTTPATKTLEQMRKALKQKRLFKKNAKNHYATQDLAIQARAKKGLTMVSAAVLASRGLSQSEKGYYWRNDKRLSRGNPMSMTEEQVDAFFKEITCPTCLIASSESWEDRREQYRVRIANLASHSNFNAVPLAGNHHQHLEGQVEAVAKLLNDFFI